MTQIGKANPVVPETKEVSNAPQPFSDQITLSFVHITQKTAFLGLPAVKVRFAPRHMIILKWNNLVRKEFGLKCYKVYKQC